MQTVVLAILSLMLAGGIYWISMDTPLSAPAGTVMQKDAMLEPAAPDSDSTMESGDAMEMKSEPEDATMEQEGSGTMRKDEMSSTMSPRRGTVEAYSPEKLALAESGKVLLFFHAAWCPICRILDAEAEANPDIIPENLTVLKVDYDSATALKKKYGVTVQHTFVQVDASGAAIAKWSDASTYAQVIARLK